MFAYNEDSVVKASDPLSYGKRVGFMEGMSTAYDAGIYETTNKSEEIAEYYYQQNKKLRELGEENIPDVNFFGLEDGHVNYRDLESYYSGKDPFYQSQEEFDRGFKRVQQYDEHVEKLRQKYPDAKLETSREMVQRFQSTARAAVSEDENQRRTVGGSVGGFIGAVGAGVDPRYNLFNTMTLGVGGVGKTAVARIGTEALGQSTIEAINEFTGGRNVREMRGMDTSWGGTATRIGFAGVGGAVIRGAGEGVGAGVKAGRRWFFDSPGDPAPPPPKMEEPGPQLSPEDIYAIRKSMLREVDPALASTRMGSARLMNDLDEVRTQLDAWDGVSPIDLKPRTDTAMPRPDGIRFEDSLSTREALGQLTVDDLARKIDPDTFRVYDELAYKSEVLRNSIEAARPGAVAQQEAVAGINARIAELTEQIENVKTSARKRKTMTQEREALTLQRDQDVQRIRTEDTGDMAEMREELMRTDFKMRDMAPVVSRSYARARGQFVADAKTSEAVRNMIGKRESRLSSADVEAMFRQSETPASAPRAQSPLADAPITARVEPNDINPSMPYLDAVNRVVEKDAKVAEEVLTAFRDSLDSLLKKEQGKVRIGNYEFDFKDRLEVPGLDGEGSRTISVREMLDEIREADIDAKAVKTCSI